jgi:hypothetical protein
VILTYLLSRFRHTSFDLLLLIVYACYASLTAISKTSLFKLITPVFIIAYINKQYLMLTISILAMMMFYPIISLSRSFVYLIEKGVVTKNIDLSLIQVIGEALPGYTGKKIFSGFGSMIQRIGGGHDVAMAAQFDNNLIAGPMVQFVIVYIKDFWGLGIKSEELLYGSSGAHAGWSLGNGGFFAHMLLVGNGSFVMMTFVSVFLGVILAISNATYLRMVRDGISENIIYLYIIFFCVFFFALSIPYWFNLFMIFSFIVVRTRKFREICTL